MERLRGVLWIEKGRGGGGGIDTKYCHIVVVFFLFLLTPKLIPSHPLPFSSHNFHHLQHRLTEFKKNKEIRNGAA